MLYARQLSEENAEVRILEVEKVTQARVGCVCVYALNANSFQEATKKKLHNNERMVAATAGKWEEKKLFCIYI